MSLGRLQLLLTILAMVLAGSMPAWAQEEGEARLGGGSDIGAGTSVRIPQGGSIPPIHVIFADNPEDEPVEVEFRAETETGIIIKPEWETRAIPAHGSVQNRFGVVVLPSVAAGEYLVVVQLVRSDIEPEPGRITTIPAIQTEFTVIVTGEAATVTMRSVSALTGEPVTGIITLSARTDDRWFEIDRTEGDTLESRVAPGDYRAEVLLGDRSLASEEVTVEADQEVEVTLEVETVSFLLAAVRPQEDNGRIVVAELVASVNNETEPVPGPAVLQARVFRGDTAVDTAVLDQFDALPSAISEAVVTYRPAGGWQPGTYRFVFELVTPEFTLTATDQPVIEVPVPLRFDLVAFFSALDLREGIALAAGLILSLAFITWLVRLLVVRRRGRHVENGSRALSSPPASDRRERRGRAGRKRARRSAEAESWIEARIGPNTGPRPRWDDVDKDRHHADSPPPSPAPSLPREEGVAGQPSGTGRDTPSEDTPRSTPMIPTPERATTPATSRGDSANLVEALRVIQQLHDHGELAPDWSITDATLIYWAMISPEIRRALDSVGMSEEDYVAAMKRLFAHGMLKGMSPDE